MSVSLFLVFNPWVFFSRCVVHQLWCTDYLQGVCMHVCVCVFRLLCLSTETLHRPPFYLHHSSSHLNPFIHPDPCASSFPFLFHSSNPYSHFLPLQRIHCLHNQHDFHWEVFSLHPWGLSPFSLSFLLSHPLLTSPTLSLVSSMVPSIWLIPLGLFLSLPHSLCFSPPQSRTCNHCSVVERYDWT